jgi:hypothetical protein
MPVGQLDNAHVIARDEVPFDDDPGDVVAARSAAELQRAGGMFMLTLLA